MTEHEEKPNIIPPYTHHLETELSSPVTHQPLRAGNTRKVTCEASVAVLEESCDDPAGQLVAVGESRQRGT